MRGIHESLYDTREATRDPELRSTPSGVSVATFTLAVDRPKNASGEKITDFIDFVAWHGRAEAIHKYTHKGQRLLVEGSLQIRNWTDTDGHKRRNSEIVVTGFTFIESRTHEENTEAQYMEDDVLWP